MSNMESYQQMQRERRAALLQKKRGNKPQSFEKKEIPAFRLRSQYFKATAGEVTRIRLLPQSNGDLFYKYYSAYVPTQNWSIGCGKPKGRFVISNAWNGERPVPCVLDYYALKEENTALMAGEREALTVVILEDYYKVPKVSRAGKDYFAYERVLGEDRFGRSLDPVEYQDYDKVFGQRLHWTMWPSQQRQFMEAVEKVTASCGNCESGEISTYGYGCPVCNHVIANHKEGPIPRNEEDILRSKKISCPSCDANIKAKPLVDCVTREGYGANASYSPGCGDPLLLDPTSMDFVIKIVPAGKGTAVEILEFGPSKNYEDMKEWLLTPFEFDKFFGMQDLDDQAFGLGRDNPFSSEDQAALEAFFESSPDEEDDDSIPF